MSEQSLELLERLRSRLSSAARRITLADLTFGLVLTFGIVSALWALSAAVEARFWLETGPRSILFWFLATASAVVLTYFLVLPLLRLAGVLKGPSADFVAHRVGDRFPEVGDRLVNLLDLSEGRRTDAPDELVDRAVQMLGREVDPVRFEDVADFSRARRAARLAVVPILALLFFVVAAPSTFFDASMRILSPGEHFDQPAPFRLEIEPGSTEVARGSGLELVARATGSELPRAVELQINHADEEHVESVRLHADSTGAFRHTIANVRRSFRYRVAAVPVQTRWYDVQVTEHPLVRSLQVTLQFPGYSGVPPQRLDPNVGDVSGLRGTRVTIELALGGSASSSAYLAFDEGSTVPLELDDDRASGTFTLTRDGTYHIVLENDRGIQNLDPIRYGMDVVDDAPPSVVIVRPEADALLAEDLRRTLETRITDDYGFHDLTLFYRLAESRFGQTSETFSTLELPLSDPRQLDQDVAFDWNVGRTTSLDPVPGDVIEYYVRVRDNDTFAGYKASTTALQRLRLPSLAEQYERLSSQQDEAENQLGDMMDQARQLEEQFRELRDEVRRKQDADWEDQRQLQQLEQQQQQMEQQVDDLSRQIEEMNRSAEQNNLLSEETLEKFREMQSVVEEINSPELREALRQLQESIENLDLSRMQEAIENFEFNEQQYQQRLERALELFKNLRAQQSLEEAARRAEELARQQEQLAEKTADLLNEDADESRDQTEQKAEQAEESGEQAEESTSGEEESDRADDENERSGEEEEARDEASDAKDGDPESSEETPDGERSDQQDAEEGSEHSEQNSSDQPQEPSGSEESSPTPDESPQEQLARQQELSKEEMRALEELLREAQRQIEELQKGPKEQMEELNESVRQQQMPEKMEENAQQLRQNQLQNAKSGQQQMQQQLQQLQQQLSQMQNNMQGQQMQVNLAGLRKALGDILTLSKDQEELRRRLRANVSEAPSLREDARRQVELSEGLSTVIDSLQALSNEIPQMSRSVQRLSGQALREMGQATEAMTDRSVGEAAGYQTGAMMNLNELALLLSDVLNQLMNQSGSGGGGGNMQQMIQQMQQMAEQQQQLNQQIQQFLNDMQGNRLSSDMQQRLQQMSAQQQAIKRQLDELRRNPEARGTFLGDLDRIAEQMEETIQELQQRQVEPRTVERQQQILQRLLDAQRSINERGREERREAREGEDLPRDRPADLPPAEAAEKLRRDLIRALESGYAPDYEELIKRYFELLQQEETPGAP